jgi:hypothetical protein
MKGSAAAPRSASERGLVAFSGVAFQQRAHDWMPVNFASAFVVSFNSANAFDELDEEREWRIRTKRVAALRR